MPIYTVTAANKWYFQVLAVEAVNEAEAAAKFRAWLAAPEQQAHEEFEAEQVQGMDDSEADPEAFVRSNYSYGFDDYQIETELPHWLTRPISTDVQMVHSGGNG